MKHIGRLTALGVALTGLLAATPEASVNHTSYVTFGVAVTLPGVTLRAGTYVFELPADDRSLVQVSSRDRSRVFFKGFTHLVNRPQGIRSDEQVTLGDVASDQAPPVRVWYPVVAEAGREFIYRK